MLRRHARGFTLIEVMVAITIFAILVALGVPAFRTYMANSKIRTAASSYEYGITLARAEAVRLNTLVEFVTTASGWQVQRMDGTVLQSASGHEGQSNVTLTFTSQFGSVTSNIVTFNSVGRIQNPNPADNSNAITQIDITLPNASNYDASALRPLRVLVQPGGSSMVCDPAVPSTDPRSCV